MRQMFLPVAQSVRGAQAIAQTLSGIAQAQLREALRHADPSTFKRFGKDYVFVG